MDTPHEDLAEFQTRVLEKIASCPDNTWWVKQPSHTMFVGLHIGGYIERVFRRKPYGYGYKLTDKGLSALPSALQRKAMCFTDLSTAHRAGLIHIGLQKAFSYRCYPDKSENKPFEELVAMGLCERVQHKKMVTYRLTQSAKSLIIHSPADWGGEWIANSHNVRIVKEKIAGESK